MEYRVLIRNESGHELDVERYAEERMDIVSREKIADHVSALVGLVVSHSFSAAAEPPRIPEHRGEA